jgi:hypothetical protein
VWSPGGLGVPIWGRTVAGWRGAERAMTMRTIAPFGQFVSVTCAFPNLRGAATKTGNPEVVILPHAPDMSSQLGGRP